jgi:hypothetical protein
LKIMTSRTAPAQLWTSMEAAFRLTLRSLSAPSAVPSAFEDIEGEQARIRRTSRHWLLG